MVSRFPAWLTSFFDHETNTILRLGIPIALAHLANMSMSLVDTAFVGRIGVDAVGGLALGNAVFNTLMVGSLGLLLGLDFLISHAHGSNQHDEADAYAAQAAHVATLTSLPCIAVIFFFSDHFLWFGTTPAIAAEARSYLRAISWSLWPFLLFTAFRFYLQGLSIALPILYMLLAANIVNAFANWLLVFGNWGFPALGVAGSGLATGLARGFLFISVVLYIVFRDQRHGSGVFRMLFTFSRERIWHIIRIGAPAAGQVLLEMGVFATATILAGRLGAVPLAAHQVVLMIASFTFMVPLGLASAGAVCVAQALGARDRHRAVRTGAKAMILGAGFMTLCGIILFAGNRQILGFFVTDPRVLVPGWGLMLLAAFFQIFDGVQVTGSGVLRGLGNTRASFFINLIGHWGIGLPLGAFLCFGLGWGIHGVWVGLSIGLLFVAIGLLMAWRRISRQKLDAH